MRRVVQCVVAVLALSVGAGGPAVAGADSGPAGGAAVTGPGETVETWAWCGVHPFDPAAERSARAMASVAGIDVTFGPCNVPTPDYTPAFTANRYAPPEVYVRLVALNARAGMRTVVYDARLWSDAPDTRDAALGFWRPWFRHIAAWDLGDEFDPASPEWALLVERWQRVLNEVTPRSGIPPYTNHLEWAVDAALRDLPGSEGNLSFTQYRGDLGVATARRLAAAASLMCGVNAYDHWDFHPTAETIQTGMNALADAGCDRILVFGGHPAYGTTAFGDHSIVDRDGNATSWANAVLEGAGTSSYRSVEPARLLDTRPDGTTVDGTFAGIGRRPALSSLALQVAGRTGIPTDATSVTLAVTVTGAATAGFVTVHPCDAMRPTAAQITHGAADLVTTTVVVPPSVDGRVCLYTMAETDLVVDVNGYTPAGSSLTARPPTRLLDTRSGPEYPTADGAFAGIGQRPAGTVTALPVAGRVEVPAAVSAVVLSVTATNPTAPGFVTVFPCGQPVPATSTLNLTAGATVTNTVVTGVDADGAVCLFTSTATDLVVDLSGHHPPRAPVATGAPLRLLDTRAGPGITTIDGLGLGGGPLAAGSVLMLQVGGRAGLPATMRAGLLNVTVTEPGTAGFVTVFPCEGQRPTASHVNHGEGQTVANLVVAGIGDLGTVCLFTLVRTHLVVDLTGVLP